MKIWTVVNCWLEQVLPLPPFRSYCFSVFISLKFSVRCFVEYIRLYQFPLSLYPSTSFHCKCLLFRAAFFSLFLCFTIIFVLFFSFIFSDQYFSFAFLFAQLHERVPQVVYVVWVHLWCGFGILSIVFSYHYTNASDFTNHWGLLYMNRCCNEMVVNDDALFPFCFLHFCMALYCRHYTKYHFTFVMLLSIKQFSGQIYGIIEWNPPMFYHHSALVEQ